MQGAALHEVPKKKCLSKEEDVLMKGAALQEVRAHGPGTAVDGASRTHAPETEQTLHYRRRFSPFPATNLPHTPRVIAHIAHIQSHTEIDTHSLADGCALVRQ